jgi:hypothetical protein
MNGASREVSLNIALILQERFGVVGIRGGKWCGLECSNGQKRGERRLNRPKRCPENGDNHERDKKEAIQGVAPMLMST